MTKIPKTNSQRESFSLSWQGRYGIVYSLYHSGPERGMGGIEGGREGGRETERLYIPFTSPPQWLTFSSSAVLPFSRTALNSSSSWELSTQNWACGGHSYLDHNSLPLAPESLNLVYLQKSLKVLLVSTSFKLLNSKFPPRLKVNYLMEAWWD